MSDDMSDLFQKMNDMIKNNEIPDGIKEMIGKLNSNSSDNANNNSSDYSNTASSNTNSSDSDSTHTEMPNIDMATMMKMKAMIDNMNKPQNDPRANLLRSLKPYLKTSRKSKVDQYIQLFSMGKVFEMMNPLGGKKKNDG